MRIGHVSGQRQQPSDRNISLVGGIYDDTVTAPHALTDWVTYTVPTGKKAQVTSAVANITRTEAATTDQNTAAWVESPVGVLVYSFFRSKTVNASSRQNVGLSSIFVAGQTLYCASYDDSPNGTCAYQISMQLMEYDA